MINQDLVRRATQALDVVLDPQSSPRSRHQSSQFCEDLKQAGGQSAIEIGYHLAVNRSHSLALRNFGLSLLGHVAQHGYHQLSADERVLLRQCAWHQLAELNRQSVASGYEETRLIMEKASAVLAQVVLHQWPDDWPDFADTILGVLFSPDLDTTLLLVELVLMALRDILAVTHGPADGDHQPAASGLVIDPSRRTMVAERVKDELVPRLLDWMYQAIPGVLGRLEQKQMAMVADPLIGCFAALASWAPLDPPASVIGLMQAMLEALVSPSIGEQLAIAVLEALQCLLVVRPLQPSELVLVEWFLDDPGVAQTIHRLFAAYYHHASVEQYPQLKLLSEVIVDAVLQHVASKRQPTVVPKTMASVLQLILGLTQLPSLSVCSTTIPFWNAAARLASLYETESFGAIVPGLFMTLLTLLSHDPARQYQLPLNSADFDEPADFDEVFAALQSRATDLLRQLAHIKAAEILDYTSQALHGVVGENKAALSTADCRSNQPFRQQWNAICSTIEAVQRGIAPAVIVDDAKLCGDLNRLLQFLLSIGPPADPEILTRWLYAVRSIGMALGHAIEQFGRLIETLFGLALNYQCSATALGPSEAAAKQQQGYAVVSRTCGCLLKLGEAAPLLFLPYLTPVVEAVRAFGTRYAERSSERRMLSELLLLLSAKVADEQDRRALFESIVAPVVEQITVLRQDGRLEETTRFYAAIGGAAIGQPARSLDDESVRPKQLRRTITLTLTTSLSIIKRAPKPDDPTPTAELQPAFSTIVAFLLSLGRAIRSVERLSGGQFWGGCRDQIFGLLDGEAEEEPAAVTETAVAMDDDNPSGDAEPDTVEQQCRELRNWFRSVKLVLYLALGLACSYREHFFTGQVGRQLEASVLADLDRLHLAELTWILKHLVHPFVTACPVSRYEDDLAVVLATVFRGLERALASRRTAYFELLAAAAGEGEARRPREAAEQALERSITAGTSAAAILLYDCLVATSERAGSRPEPTPLLDLRLALASLAEPPVHAASDGPVAHFIINEAGPPLLDAVLALLREILSCGAMASTTAVLKTMQVLLRWTPCLVQTDGGRHRSAMFQEFLPAVLPFLTVERYAEQHGQIVTLVAELYKWQLWFGFVAAGKPADDIIIERTRIPTSLDGLVVRSTVGEGASFDHRTLFALQLAMAKEPNVRNHRTLMRNLLLQPLMAVPGARGKISRPPGAVGSLLVAEPPGAARPSRRNQRKELLAKKLGGDPDEAEPAELGVGGLFD